MSLDIKAIDLTPTWSAIVLTLAECYAGGSQAARDELLRLAAIADLAVAREKHKAGEYLAANRKETNEA